MVGADGRYSTIARAVRARDYDHVPMDGGGVYAYFEDVPAEGFEFWMGTRGWAMIVPSHEGSTHVATYVFSPAGSTSTAPSNGPAGTPQERFDRVIRAYPDLHARIAAGRRRTPLVAHVDAPAHFREAYGPGWALVGDAGFHQGPWNGYGMSHAFRDADRLAAAIDEWQCGASRAYDESLGGYARDRDAWCRASGATFSPSSPPTAKAGHRMRRATASGLTSGAGCRHSGVSSCEQRRGMDTALALAAITFAAAIVNGALGYGFSSIMVPLALLFLSNRVLNPRWC